MFIIKNNYYLYIENTESIDLNYIKKNKKISIIYRNNRKAEDLVNLNKFRRECKIKRFKFYIANNLKLAIPHKSLTFRNFVLFPLKEISPNWQHPISNKKIDFYIEKLDLNESNQITRINESATIAI